MLYLFWISFGIIFFTYIGYPSLLYFNSLFVPKKPKIQLNQQFSVSVIIAALNEEKLIQEKIANTLAQNYPAHLLQIIVVADGSTDATVSLASEFKNVLVLFEPERKGKAMAINHAVESALNEIIILTDANSFMEPNAINELLKFFADKKVGAVAGEKKLLNANRQNQNGEGLYWKYESWVKQQETNFYTVIGAAGELLAIRKNLFKMIPAQMITDDFFLSVSVNLQQFKVAYARKAITQENASLSISDEWKRKVRIAAGGFQSLFIVSEAMNFFKHPVLAFQFFSHRVLRWLFCSPAFVILFVSNGFLIQSSSHFFYLCFFYFQLLFYVIALTGWLFSIKKKYFILFEIPFYVVFMHVAMFAGFVKYFTGKQTVLWEKAKR